MTASPSSTRGRVRGRTPPPRGLTLLEVLIALALLVALGAIAFPAMMRGLDARTFDAAGDQVLNQLLLARATAQETGRSVEVIYMPPQRRVVARYFVVAPGDANDRALPDETAPWPDLEFDGDDEAEPIFESWADRDLPDGVEMRASAPPTDEGSDDFALSDARLIDTFPDDVPSDEPQTDPWRVAVFLPDGSALLSADAWLVDAQGRSTQVRVSPWTGLPTLNAERGASTEPLDETDDDQEPPDLEDDVTDEVMDDEALDDEADLEDAP